MKLTLNKKINIYKFLEKLIFVAPFYALMFKENGLTATQIATLFVAWKMTTVICEYPTGVIADKYSRKIQLILAQIIFGTGLLLWSIGNSYYIYMLGFMLWGISGALKSGTFQAFLYDQLKEENREFDYKKVYARASSISHFGLLIASLLATLIFKIGSYNLTIYLSVIALLLSTLPILSIRESKYHKSTGEVEEWNIMREAFQVIAKNKSLFAITLLVASFDAIGTPVDEYATLLAENSGLLTAYLGIFMITQSVGLMLGTEIIHKIELTYKQSQLVLLMDALVLIAAGYLVNYISLVLIFIDAVLISILDVSFEENIQILVPSNVRASVSSIKGLVSRLFASVLLLSFGIVGDAFSIGAGYMFLGLLVMTLPIVMNLAQKKRDLQVLN